MGPEPKRCARESKLLPKRGAGEGERDRARTLSVREGLLEISRLVLYVTVVVVIFQSQIDDGF